MNDANTFSVNISSCNPGDEHAGDIFSASVKREFNFESKQEGVQCDSATTTVFIGGVPFKKFRLTTKKNNRIQQNYMALFSCYKGYAVYITLLLFSKKAGEEMESMLTQSTFSK